MNSYIRDHLGVMSRHGQGIWLVLLVEILINRFDQQVCPHHERPGGPRNLILFLSQHIFADVSFFETMFPSKAYYCPN